MWKKGNIVFVNRTNKANAAAGTVGKLIFAVIGPWEIFKDSQGGSNKILHYFDKNRVDKKHTPHLSMYSLELINFEPADGPDNRYN